MLKLKRLLIALALCAALCVTALAGDMGDVGAPAPLPEPQTTSDSIVNAAIVAATGLAEYLGFNG